MAAHTSTCCRHHAAHTNVGIGLRGWRRRQITVLIAIPPLTVYALSWRAGLGSERHLLMLAVKPSKTIAVERITERRRMRAHTHNTQMHTQDTCTQHSFMSYRLSSLLLLHIFAPVSCAAGLESFRVAVLPLSCDCILSSACLEHTRYPKVTQHVLCRHNACTYPMHHLRCMSSLKSHAG
jgi:hypothetical protein